MLVLRHHYKLNMDPEQVNSEEIKHSKFLLEHRRRNVIQLALTRLKRKNEGYLQSLQSNPKWRKIYNGLLYNNCQSELKNLISLQLCEANDNQDPVFFNPFQKTPITICYNKLNLQQNFQKHALYNLVLLYDSRVKREMSWNNLDQTAKSTVRALNLSGLCVKTDQACFQKELTRRVLQKERFKGKLLNFKQIIQSGIADMSPISQVSYS